MIRSGSNWHRGLGIALVLGILGPLSGHAATVLFQAAGNSFKQTNPDGLVVMEAESAQSNTSQGGHDWTLTTAFAGYSGTGAMQATPDSGTGNDTGFAAASPRLNFSVNFISTGTHYVWVRGWAPTGAGTDDSVHVGLDGAEVATSDRITGFGTAFTWHKNTMDNVDATLNIATAGVHTINVWMREDGFVCDKILLTTNAAYTPTGAGPAQSLQLAAPQNLMATPGYDRVTLTWDAVTGATSYVVLRSGVAGGPVANPYVQIATVTAPAVTYIDLGATYPGTYYYVVRAVSAAGTSANSAEDSATPLQLPVKATPISGLQTNEGGSTTTFTVKYNVPAPAGGSTLTVSSGNLLEGTVSALNLTTTATPSGFSYVVAQGAMPTITVVVTGKNDFVVDGDITYTISITASGIAVPVPSVTCTNNDDDVQGITVSRTAGLTTTEGGGKDSYSVVLNREPFKNVSFTLASSNPLEGTIDKTTLTFTNGSVVNDPNAWNASHVVTLTGVNDALLDFAVPYQIVPGALVFADTRDRDAFIAAGVTVPTVSAVNLDDEVPPELPAVWGGGGCGLLGLEGFFVLALVTLRRRRA